MDPSVFATICIDSTNQSALDLICTLISNLSGQPDTFLGSGTLKNMGAKYGVQSMGCKKQGVKNRVIVIQKEKRQPGESSIP